jgi:hypothetical protein
MSAESTDTKTVEEKPAEKVTTETHEEPGKPEVKETTKTVEKKE